MGSQATRPTPTPLPLPTPLPDAPLAVKLGQMFLVGFGGMTINDKSLITGLIRDSHLGAVVLFNNVRSRAQVRQLTVDLQAQATIPLLIATDQEGGRISRLRTENGFPATRSPQELGATNNLYTTASEAHIIARSLAESGINFNLAPVVDLNTNPANPIVGSIGRSYSADPAVVTRHARTFVTAQQNLHIGSTLKHFPGHGSSTTDSHYGFVDVTESWQQEELIPYRELIQFGCADAIMAAHVFNQSLDPIYPASLSPATLTLLLRGELGFDGVILTDDLRMGAIAQSYTLEEAVAQAVIAGADMLSLSDDRGAQGESLTGRAIDHLTSLVESGEIPMARIDQAYHRILTLKANVRMTALENPNSG